MSKEKEKKGFLEGWRKFLTGVGLTGVGLYLGFNGDWDNGWKFITVGVGIMVGGNAFDHIVNKKKEVKK